MPSSAIEAATISSGATPSAKAQARTQSSSRSTCASTARPISGRPASAFTCAASAPLSPRKASQTPA